MCLVKPVPMSIYFHLPIEIIDYFDRKNETLNLLERISSR